MKRFLPLLCATLATSLPVLAQYNPPPPPEEQQQGAPDQPPPPDMQNQGGPGPADQGPPPTADQDGAPPMDPNAPPPDQNNANAPTDQGAPPPDQNGSPDQDGAAPPDQSGDDQGGDANFQTFYDNLSSQGNWVQTDNYGYVWQPNVQDPDWRPYSNGHWVYSDEGWTWVAAESEPWGWATYHYGRWANLDGTGWVWVPGYTWAPAWVSWRYGGGYCGWAPLPPATFVGVDFGGGGFGFHIGGDCDTAYGIGPAYYNFIPVGYIGGRDYRGYYVNRYNNYTIINNTRNVTNIVVNNQAGAGRFGRVQAGGPSVAAVNAQSRTPVQRVTLARSGRMGNASLAGNRLAVFAPRVAAAGATGTFRPRNVSGNLANVRVNNGANINQPLTTTARVRGNGPSAEQVQAAQGAMAHASAAHVATVNTRPSQTLSQPLASFRPHNEGAARAPAAAGNTHTATHEAASSVRPEASFTGEPSSPAHASSVNRSSEAGTSSEVHHSSQPREPSEVHSSEAHTFTPQEHHESAPVHQQAAPEVQHQESHPQQIQQQHQDFHPQAQQHAQQQVQHAAAQANHPAPAANHGGGPRKDDKKKTP